MHLGEIVDRHLPPPNMLRLPAVGVDISDTSLKYIGFHPGRSQAERLRLRTWGDITIEPGILNAGEIEDTTALAKALAEVKKRTGHSYARLSLPDEHSYLFETQIPSDVSGKELYNILEFKLEENVPLSPRDAYFDYQIPEGQDDKDEKWVVVTTAAKSIVDPYLEACLKAGITPLSFVVEPAAIARSVLPCQDKGTRLLVDFGQTRTGIGITHNGVLMYTSTIDIGGKDLSASLRRTLGDKPEDELTRIKNEQGLVRSAEDAVAFEAMMATVSAIKDELSTRIQYWNDKATGQTDRYIEDVILCGGSANLRGLPAYLSKTLGLPVSMADVWQNAFSTNEVVPPIDLRHSYGYATAIGLALSAYEIS